MRMHSPGSGKASVGAREGVGMWTGRDCEVLDLASTGIGTASTGVRHRFEKLPLFFFYTYLLKYKRPFAY